MVSTNKLSKDFFAENLKTLRKKHNLRQYELSDILGVSRTAISLYEAGLKKPSYNTLVAIAEYFKVDLNWLLGVNAKRHSKKVVYYIDNKLIAT